MRRYLAMLVCAFFFVGCLANLRPEGAQENGQLPGGQGGDVVGNGSGGGVESTTAQVPFDPVSPSSYVNKVKVLMTGLGASRAEVAQGGSDAGLSALLDAWMATDAFEQVLLRFFGLAFQQSAFQLQDICMQMPYTQYTKNRQNFVEMFPRTALYFAKNNRPFNQLASTNQYMLTPYLVQQLIVMDKFIIADDGSSKDQLQLDQPDFNFTLVPTNGASSINDLIDPKSSNYMRMTWSKLNPPPDNEHCGCYPDKCGYNGGPMNISAKETFEYISPRFAAAMAGLNFSFNKNTICYTPVTPETFYLPSDTTSWRPVTILPPPPGQKPPEVWDLPLSRTASTVYLNIPRVGYFTTPAFLGQWATNANNQARVTINQTLAVGLNKVFDGTDSTMPSDLSALPVAHAAPDSSCYGCHLTMDPMRQYFRQALTLSYHQQQDSKQSSMPGAYAQAGATATGGGLAQLGNMIAASPLFASAWTMKVCMWLNSGPCVASDPEIARIAGEFAASNYNFLKMFKSVALSPLTTYKASSATAQARGPIVSIARAEQLCQTLSARLNTQDVCNRMGTQTSQNLQNAGLIFAAYPQDGYSRATTVWAQSTTPNLLTRNGLEGACSYLAEEFVDGSNAQGIKSQDTSAAGQKIVSTLLGLDPQSNSDVAGVLADHISDVMASGASQSDAVKSAFVLGCLSPYVSSIGL